MLTSSNKTASRLQPTTSPRRGMVSFATLFAMLFLMAFTALVFNTGRTVTRKIEAQNAADAVAYSSSVWIARGMNAVTAANHMIGELNALYILHHSLGGKWLDENSRDSENHEGLEKLNGSLEVAYNLASLAKIRPYKPAYDKVIQTDPCASVESTIYQAKKQLKKALLITLGIHAAAIAGEYTPPPGPFFAALVEAACLIVEIKIYIEYVILDGVEILAQTTKGFAHTLVGVDEYGNDSGVSAVGSLLAYTEALQIAIPVQLQGFPPGSNGVAAKVAERHGAEGLILGDIPAAFSLSNALDFLPQMPIEKSTHKGADRSQLMRATYPWVCRWRKPIRDFFKISCTISGAAGFYTKYTNKYSRQCVLWQQLQTNEQYRGFEDYGMGKKGKNYFLFVVKGLNDTEPGKNGYHKSQEVWNKPDQNRVIENLFTHIGFSRVTPFDVASNAVFRQEAPDGFVCFAQSMIYNANSQQAPANSGKGGDPQPTVGYDTLNWTSGAIEYPTDSDLGNAPTIKLNWQARLTPATPLKLGATATAAGILNSAMAEPLEQSIPALYLNTH